MYQDIEIEKLREAKNNYRKNRDKTAMDELTESVRTKGVLQPILVRALAGDDGTYEIVAGHRRFQAASAASLQIMPAIVKVLSDEEALEIQVVENSQREDPNPMEEAHGFKRLLKMGKHTSDTLAEKIGHSVKYVLGRLKLLDLPKDAQKSIASGDLGMGHALLLTRLKKPADQKELLDSMSRHDGMTVLEATRRIRNCYSLKIEDAAFDIDDCETCAYRSRNQTVLFPDLKETDECMDKECYFTKTETHYQAVIDTRKAEGFKIFTTENDVEKHTGHNAKGSYRIAAPGAGKECRTEKPRRYKSECMKCFEHHAFYMYIETDRWNGRKSIEAGEICLKKSCLDKMNKLGTSGSASSSAGTEEDYNEIQRCQARARECRDRFLEASIKGPLMCSATMQIRLTIFIIADRYGKAHDALSKFCENAKSHRYGDRLYAAITEIPEDELAHVVSNMATAAFGNMNGDIMLRMAPEADVVVERDFVIDREWLESQSFKKKSDLVALVDELSLEADTTLTKVKLIDAILELDLKGKVPKAISEACKIEEPEANCDECFEPLEECECSPEEEESAATQAAPKVVSPWCPKCHYDESMCECKISPEDISA